MTGFTDDDTSVINESSLENQLSGTNRVLNIMFSAIDALQQNDFDVAIKIFTRGVEYFEGQQGLKNASYNVSLFYCNISLCYFYKNDLDQVAEALDKASSALDLQNNIKNEYYRLLYLKILANFLVLKVKIQDFSTLEQIVNLLQIFIDSEKNPNKKANYISHVIYQLFKRDSFILNANAMDQQVQNLSASSKGICLIQQAFDWEFQGNKEKATEKLFDALQHYQDQQDNVMCLIVIRHLMEILKGNQKKYDNLRDYYEKLAQNESNAREIEGLFEDFDKKIEVVKSLVKILKNYEEGSLKSLNENFEP